MMMLFAAMPYFAMPSRVDVYRRFYVTAMLDTLPDARLRRFDTMAMPRHFSRC